MNAATSPVSDPAQVTQIFEGIETSLRQQRSAFEAAVGAVDGQLQLLREQVREHLEDTRAQQQISTLEAERAQLSEAMKEQRAQREQLEHKLEELREALAKEQAHVQELREELAERGGAADAARARVTALEAQAKDQEARAGAHAEQVAALETKVQALEAALADAQSSGSGAQAKTAELEHEVQKLAHELQAAAKTADQVESLQEEATTLKARLKQAEKAVAEHNQQSGGLQEEVQTLRAGLSDREAEAATLRDALEKARAETAQLQSALKTAASPQELQRLKEAADTATEKLSEMEAKLEAETSRGTKTVIAAQLAQALQDAEAANQEVRRLRKQVEDLRAASPAAAPNPVSETQRVQEVIARQRGGQKRSLGELLVEAEIVTQDQVNDSLDVQRKNPHQHIGAILVERNLASEEAVAQALAYQCGVQYLSLDGHGIEGEAVLLLNERLAQKHGCIPIAATDEAITLAMSNPADLVAIEDIERATGRKVEVVVSTAAEIRAAIEKHFQG